MRVFSLERIKSEAVSYQHILDTMEREGCARVAIGPYTRPDKRGVRTREIRYLRA